MSGPLFELTDNIKITLLENSTYKGLKMVNDKFY